MNKAQMKGEKMAAETATVLSGANLMAWAAEQFRMAADLLREGHKEEAAVRAAAGMKASQMA